MRSATEYGRIGQYNNHKERGLHWEAHRVDCHIPALSSPRASAAIRTSGSSKLTLLARPSKNRSGEVPVLLGVGVSTSIRIGEPASST